MKQDYTHIIVVLDRSGSMESVKSDTIGGFNRLLSDQKALPGTATLTLIQFDNQYEVVHENRNLQSAPNLTDATFEPRGSTALFDAIGRTINDEGQRFAGMNESDRPEKIVFIILTDGHENASRSFSKSKIKEMITHQHDAYQWQFLFVGANQDAVLSGAEMGIPMAGAMTYTADSHGTQSAFRSLSNATTSYRVDPNAKSAAFNDTDRAAQKSAEK